MKIRTPVAPKSTRKSIASSVAAEKIVDSVFMNSENSEKIIDNVLDGKQAEVTAVESKYAGLSRSLLYEYELS